MLNVKLGDITALKNVDAIVNAANGQGPMGRGVAGAIGQAGGLELRNEVRRICEDRHGYLAGECYISSSGLMSEQGIKNVYHAVTMDYPGSPTSIFIISRAMRATLDAAILNGIKSIAFPALGTGVGQLDKKTVASAMVKIAMSYADKLDITIIDINKEFIDYVNGLKMSE